VRDCEGGGEGGDGAPASKLAAVIQHEVGFEQAAVGPAEPLLCDLDGVLDLRMFRACGLRRIGHGKTCFNEHTRVLSRAI